MKHLRKDSRGVTLVEVIAVVLLIFILMFLIFPALSNSKNQFTIQQDNNEQIFDIAYALKLITKDIRMYPSNISISKSEPFDYISIIDNSSNEIKYSYNSTTKTIDKNGNPFASNITKFQITKSGELIKLEIESNSKSITTEISLREGA